VSVESIPKAAREIPNMFASEKETKIDTAMQIIGIIVDL
jgi:hypothetical protein